MSNTRTTRPRLITPAPGPVRDPQQDAAVLHAAALGLALDDQPWQPACVQCVRRAKAAEAGGDPMPDVAQSITWLPSVGPVCYGCFG